MLDFIVKRFLQILIVIFLALTLVFFITRLSGGDPVLLFLPMDASTEQIEEFKEKHGYNESIFIQYKEFMLNAVKGDFGKSIRSKEDALSLVLQRIPATIQLAISALIISLIVAIPLGVISAYKRNSLFDRISVTLTVIGQATPNFWLGLLLIYIFAAKFKILPSGGSGSVLYMILPTIALSTYTIARFTRFTRATMLDVLQKGYIETSKAYGVPTYKIIMKFALRNALIPIITIIALDFGTLLGGAVIIETVFAWPGLGRLILQSLLNRDFPIVLSGIFVISIFYSVINFIVDILYTYINPQVKVK